MNASSVVSWRRESINAMVPMTISAMTTTMATSTNTGRFHSGGLPSSSFLSLSSFLSPSLPSLSLSSDLASFLSSDFASLSSSFFWSPDLSSFCLLASCTLSAASKPSPKPVR